MLLHDAPGGHLAAQSRSLFVLEDLTSDDVDEVLGWLIPHQAADVEAQQASGPSGVPVPDQPDDRED